MSLLKNKLKNLILEVMNDPETQKEVDRFILGQIKEAIKSVQKTFEGMEH